VTFPNGRRRQRNKVVRENPFGTFTITKSAFSGPKSDPGLVWLSESNVMTPITRFQYCTCLDPLEKEKRERIREIVNEAERAVAKS
jgi:hypothetical protein